MLKLKYWVLMTALLTTSVSADRIKDLLMSPACVQTS